MNLRTNKMINLFVSISQFGDPEVKTRTLTLILGFKLYNNLFFVSYKGHIQNSNALHFWTKHRNCKLGME